MYRKFFLALSHSATFKKFFVWFPLTKKVVRRFISGESWDEASEVLARLIGRGMQVSVDYLGEDTTDESQAEAMVGHYMDLLDNFEKHGWAEGAEVSIKLTAIGMSLPGGEELAIANTKRIAARADQIGTKITIDMEDYTVTEKTIRIVKAVRVQYPSTGCVLQSSLKRTEADCVALDGPQSRTRLCKGAYDSPATVAFSSKHDINLSYVRCLKALMEGEGRPLVATHDPIMIDIAQELAAHTNRGLGDYEFQMLYGIRTMEQERLVDLGHTVRVYVPFGTDWYGYFVRRLAERPANLLFFLRSFLPAR